ncbi:MAG: AAA family ATPase [Firmicutes bacterium]|nr:AAA family ATPase [Bacillota bacterium]
MKLEQIKIDGFGILHNLTIDLEPDLTVIYGLNGSGKSTLLNFVRSCLYGFYQRGSQQRYEPIKGGNHGGSLRIIDGEQQYLVSRVPDRRSSGALIIEDLKSGISLSENQINDLLGGISQSLFETVYAFGLDELQQLKLLDNNDLNSLLYSIGIGSTISLADIEGKLINAMDRIYKPRGRKPELNQVLDQLQEINSKLRESSRVTDEYRQLKGQIIAAKKAAAEIRSELDVKKQTLKRVELMLEAWPQWQKLVVIKQNLERIPNRNLPVDGAEKLTQAKVELERINSAYYQAAAKIDPRIELQLLENREYQQLLSEFSAFADQIEQAQIQVNVAEERYQQAAVECRELQNQITAIEDQIDGSEDEFLVRKRLFEQLKQIDTNPEPGFNRLSVLLGAVGVCGWLVAAFLFSSSNYNLGMGITAGVLVLIAVSLGTMLVKSNRAAVRHRNTLKELTTKLGITNPEFEMLSFEQKLLREEELRQEINRLSQQLMQLEARTTAYRQDLAAKHQQKALLLEQLRNLLKRYHLPDDLTVTEVETYLQVMETLPNLLQEKQLLEQQLKEIYQACQTNDPEQIAHWYRVQAEREQLAQEAANLEVVLQTYFGTEYKDAVVFFEGTDKETLMQQQEDLKADILQLSLRLDQLQQNIGGLTAQKEMIEQSYKHEEYQLEREVLQAKARELAVKWGSLKTCQWVIGHVSRKYERERQPRVLKAASEYFAAITDNRYTRVYAPIGMKELKIETANGEILAPHQLSRGTVEQLYLAIRFALALQIGAEKVELPIFADDILVNFDRQRLMNTVELMKLISKQHQIVLLTCHENIAKLFAPQQVRYLNGKANTAC